MSNAQIYNNQESRLGRSGVLVREIESKFMCGCACFAGEGLHGLVICPCILAFIYYFPSKCLLTHINTYIHDLRDTHRMRRQTVLILFPLPSLSHPLTPSLSPSSSPFWDVSRKRKVIYWEYSSTAVVYAVPPTLPSSVRLTPAGWILSVQRILYSQYFHPALLSKVFLFLFLNITFIYIFTFCSGGMGNVLSNFCSSCFYCACSLAFFSKQFL